MPFLNRCEVQTIKIIATEKSWRWKNGDDNANDRLHLRTQSYHDLLINQNYTINILKKAPKK